MYISKKQQYRKFAFKSVSHSESRKRYFELQRKQIEVTCPGCCSRIRPRKYQLRQTMLPLHLSLTFRKFTSSNPGRNLKQWNYRKNRGPMNRENSHHTSKAFLGSTVTVQTRRAMAPLQTQDYRARTRTWTHQTP